MANLNVNKSVALYYFDGKAWVPWQGGSASSASNITPIETLALYVFDGSSYVPWDGTFPGSGSGGSPTGAAGGDLSGTYPNPVVHQVNGAAVPTSQAYVGTDSGGHIVAAATPSAGITQLTGDVTAGPGSGSQPATLSTTAVTPGNYTNTNLTVDGKGRITAASNGSTAPTGAAGGDLSGSYPNPTVAKIQGTAVDSVAPVDQQILQYQNSTGKWEPTKVPGYGSFYINSGAVANPAAWSLVKRASSTISKIVFYVLASDATTDLTFDIKKNGTSILTSAITVTHGTASGTINTYTTLTSSPLSLAQNDVMTLVITSGTTSWLGQINLE